MLEKRRKLFSWCLSPKKINKKAVDLTLGNNHVSFFFNHPNNFTRFLKDWCRILSLNEDFVWQKLIISLRVKFRNNLSHLPSPSEVMNHVFNCTNSKKDWCVCSYKLNVYCIFDRNKTYVREKSVRQCLTFDKTVGINSH